MSEFFSFIQPYSSDKLYSFKILNIGSTVAHANVAQKDRLQTTLQRQ